MTAGPESDDSTPPVPDASVSADNSVSYGVRVAAAWIWRLFLIAAAIVAVGWVFKRFEDVFFPMALALLFTAFLRPLVDWAVRHRVPRLAAVLTSILLTIGALLGIVYFVVTQAISGGPQLISQLTKTITETRDWLEHGPLHLDSANIRSVADELIGWFKSHEGAIASEALGQAEFASRVGTGVLLTIFLLIFFLYDGTAIWRFLTKAVPSQHRERVRGAASYGFGTLEDYVRATVVVAAIDATVIGIGLAILRVPMTMPLVAVIFLGSFIPIIGSFAAGTLAVLVALSTQGWLNALIVLAILVFVMAFEGHVLQPLVLGYSVKLHPVAIIVAIGLGLMLAGIVGALLAVPLISFVYTAVTWHPGEKRPPPRDSKLTAWVRRVLHIREHETGPDQAPASASAVTAPDPEAG